MWFVNCAAAGVCILYGVYICRVLRHAPYHDLWWLRRRTRTGPTSLGAPGQRETQPTSNPMSRIEIISDADLFEVTRRLGRGEAAARLAACVKAEEGSLQPDKCPPDGSPN